MLRIYYPQVMAQVTAKTTAKSPSQWDWIALKGPDALDFLHRLTTVHVKALKPGEGMPGFLLNPQGKMRAYFHLWMISREEFFIELDSGSTGKWKKELLAVLDQMHFGEKLTIENGDSGHLSCVWLLSSGPFDKALGLGEASQVTMSASGDLRFYNHGDRDFGLSWATVWGPRAALDSWLASLGAKSINHDELEALRINQGRPSIDAELSENTNPLEVGLKEAISDNKGCYPGQEVIEKIVSLGSPARRLSKFEGSGPVPSVGDSLQVDEQSVGTVTSVSKTANGFQALAFVKKTHLKEGLEVSFSSQPASRAKLVFITSNA